jgi:exopolyphosphatase/guanosine-5'-triphosphate,3'-diphosphate pyrophosphatase
LGDGLREAGALTPQAMARGIQCLRKFAAIIESHAVNMVDAVATSALRDASNSDVFLKEARELGVPLRIIDAEEEAKYALAGVLSGIEEPPVQAMVFDVGGGSLELINSNRGVLAETASLPAGIVYLTERYLQNIPTPSSQVEACAGEILSMLKASSFSIPTDESVPIYGCGGVAVLARFMCAGGEGEEGINGMTVPVCDVSKWVEKLSALNWENRSALKGFERGREDVALAGLIVLRELLRWLRKAEFRVFTRGVREGVLIELFANR